MYKNLKAEMLKQNITMQQIADTLQIKKETASKKVNGAIGLTLNECFLISKLFKSDNTIEYLFKK